jgi:hypothetical protein
MRLHGAKSVFYADKGSIDADKGTTPRVLTFRLPDAAQEQDGHSKPKKLKIN